MKNNEMFVIKCNNIEEFREVQLYLFNLNYEWIDSKKNLYFPKQKYPLFITNINSTDNNFIWLSIKPKNIKCTKDAKYFLRKEKILKIQQK
jgi:hypothetical protein